MSEVAISVQDLRKEFILPQHKTDSLKQAFVMLGRKKEKKHQVVLENINFEIKKGDFFGIVGRNGSGKSTLLKILAGVYAPTRGVVETHGAITPFIELGVGFNPELSGRDNIFLNGALLGFSRKEMQSMYDEIVSFAELEEFMDKKLKNYSSGMQVRLAFSIAVKAKNEILIFDEVLAVGDAAFQQKCFDYFEKLKAEKQTVIFVSHDMGAVKRFCNKAIYLNEGKIELEGLPSEIANLYAESNISNTETTDTVENKLSKAHSIKAKITNQDENKVELTISYSTQSELEMYAGLSLVKDGFSVGEIVTALNKPLTGSGTVKFILDKQILNAGSYEIGGVSLFKLENRELIAVNKYKNNFIVKGDDVTRGGPLKLPDTWIYEKD